MNHHVVQDSNRIMLNGGEEKKSDFYHTKFFFAFLIYHFPN
jgi:hypothetical protein